MNALEQLKSVLCGPEGKCCITGSDEDRAIVDRALEALAQPEHSATYQKINLSLLKHSDNCRFWDEGDLCTCGASEVHELQFWKNKALAQPEKQQSWVSLTKEEINSALSKYQNWYDFAAHLENILKEKNQ